MMIISFLKRIRRKILSFAKKREFLAEGLTRVPSVKESVISDLFVWRRSDEWKTFFELLDINNLINADYQEAENNFATFVFYDRNGSEIGITKVPVKQGRQTIDTSSLVPHGFDGWGTYACFHQNISQTVSESGSFIAERGYSGYEWKDMGARGYVHGNLDAIANSDKGVEMLGTSWKENLIYQLQHVLTGPAIYEFALVNPTRIKQKVHFITSDPSLKTEICDVVQLPSRASFIKRIEIKEGEKRQLAIKSKLYMARPVVFRLQAHSMDVFHG